jgi:hypothetical protein
MTKEQVELICGILDGMKHTLDLGKTNEQLAKYAAYNVGIEDCQKIIKAYANGDLDTIMRRDA